MHLYLSALRPFKLKKYNLPKTQTNLKQNKQKPTDKQNTPFIPVYTNVQCISMHVYPRVHAKYFWKYFALHLLIRVKAMGPGIYPQLLLIENKIHVYV